MNAKITPSYDTNRKKLSSILPLNTPFTVFIEPTRHCNFKCFYCLHSSRGEKQGELEKTGYSIRNMDFELYESILHQIQAFPQKLKRIVFSGLGEPLMNPDLPRMILKAKELGVAERFDVLTNASLLTPELTDSLIEAGTTRIQVSLQGLDSIKYREISNVNIDFDKLYENLTYLYQHKGYCSVFIKIIDTLLDGEKDHERFVHLFGDISDQIYIEHLITLQHQMGDHGGQADNTRNLNNEKVIYREVCPVIFYMLQIDVDGNVFPCPVSGLPINFSIGNTKKSTLEIIWNSKERLNLIKRHLKLNRKRIPVCSNCEACACILDENEFLDDVADDLLKYY